MASTSKSKDYAIGFAVSSTAPALAALATNPMEVVKVRQQAGSLDSASRGMAGSLAHIFRMSGLSGVQAGLEMAMFREASKAFFRIGCFQPFLDRIHDPATGPAHPAKRMAAGMCSGAIAALVCNPIELVKTRQQGEQKFGYRGPIDGLRQLRASEGFWGMWRGTGVSMARSAAVTGPHLTTYSMVKERVLAGGWLSDTTPLHILASLAGGFAGIACNHPFDTIRNRLYNQPELYASAMDCARKTVVEDGVAGLYRGFWAHYMRVGCALLRAHAARQSSDPHAAHCSPAACLSTVVAGRTTSSRLSSLRS
tara:strand:- start:1288 stop:2217 length:930 start_codon:yes stop_codon:yes gene_type:complete